jgi:esterase/lipase superfamily enzyme
MAAWVALFSGCGRQRADVKPAEQETSTTKGDTTAMASIDAPSPTKIEGYTPPTSKRHRDQKQAIASAAPESAPTSTTVSTPATAAAAPPTATASEPAGFAISESVKTSGGDVSEASRTAAHSGRGMARRSSTLTEPALNVETCEDGETETVKVYYGTDRAVAEIKVIDGLTPTGWFRLTAMAALATAVLAVLSYYYSTSRAWLAGSAMGLALTAGMGIMTAYARWSPVTEECMRRTYGRERGALEVGYCNVSIPKRHTVGELERPSILHLELKENPLKHVVVLEVQEQAPDDFLSDLKGRIHRSPRREAFVFVHGFNVSFEEAARRTAQLAYDMKFDGAPIFFSWPSQGGLLGYTVDENNVVWAVPHLKSFLVNLARNSNARSVHLIAHSMGNRALTSALKEMHFELDEQCPHFHHVVLTAPDIDAEVFRRDLAPAIMKTAKRVTMYASSNDEALVLSKKVHGYARAGDSGDQLVVIAGMDTIDVSNVDTTMLGHSYYGNSRSVLADLFELLNESRPPQQRKWLSPITVGKMLYWVFSEAAGTATAVKPALR